MKIKNQDAQTLNDILRAEWPNSEIGIDESEWLLKRLERNTGIPLTQESRCEDAEYGLIEANEWILKQKNDDNDGVEYITGAAKHPTNVAYMLTAEQWKTALGY